MARRRCPATRRRQWRPRRSRNEKQLAGGLAPLHAGMPLRRTRQRVIAPVPNLELPVRDPVEQPRRARAKQIGSMDMVAEGRVADLDTLRQTHHVERPRPTEDRPIPAEDARPAQQVERTLEGLRT